MSYLKVTHRPFYQKRPQKAIKRLCLGGSFTLEQDLQNHKANENHTTNYKGLGLYAKKVAKGHQGWSQQIRARHMEAV